MLLIIEQVLCVDDWKYMKFVCTFYSILPRIQNFSVMIISRCPPKGSYTHRLGFWEMIGLWGVIVTS